jgi:hypothetical protein
MILRYVEIVIILAGLFIMLILGYIIFMLETKEIE